MNYSSLEKLKTVHGLNHVEFNDNKIEILAENAQSVLQDVFFLLSSNDVRIKEVKMSVPNLETVFLSLTGRKLRD